MNVLEFARELIDIDSTTGKEQAAGDWLAANLRALDYDVEEQPVRDGRRNVVATLGEPVGAVPVIIEDDVLVGGNCGVYEGAIVKRRSVLAAGTVITGSTPVYDVPNGRIIRAEPGGPLIIPEGAVVVPGARHVTSGRGPEWGLSVATPVIVKYRDEHTDARTALEEGLR